MPAQSLTGGAPAAATPARRPKNVAQPQPAQASPSSNGSTVKGGDAMDSLVKLITDQVMQAMNGAGGSR